MEVIDNITLLKTILWPHNLYIIRFYNDIIIIEMDEKIKDFVLIMVLNFDDIHL